jgi:hypothetical protein
LVVSDDAEGEELDCRAWVDVIDNGADVSDVVTAAPGDGADAYTVVYDVTTTRDDTFSRSASGLDDDIAGEPLEAIDDTVDEATVVGMELLFVGRLGAFDPGC